MLREKVFHFDHERIPERVVHARSSAAHGYFECTDPLTDCSTATVFAAKGKRTPVFARLSTVAGGSGSVDTPRDVRGFAVKFYTDEGNWDLVGKTARVADGLGVKTPAALPTAIPVLEPEAAPSLSVLANQVPTLRGRKVGSHGHAYR